MSVCPGHKSDVRIKRNGPITNYTVEFREMGGALIPGVVVNRTFTASGLTPYTNYTFRVVLESMTMTLDPFLTQPVF